jgi:TetR/AcrR family transcriptional repressor of nem operon
LPRPREFDEGVALDAAMQRFWRAGYAATSLRDLGEAMHLGPASVYNAFGDKRTLFTQCLDRYLDANMRESRLGCFLANAALEVAPHDAGIADVVAARMGELEEDQLDVLDRRLAESEYLAAAEDKLTAAAS